ncbi:uncharacterized protein [Amphiura filiformis]|uniref:uncharacterized protein n=1 Tax=Amphiura filiformis TaxID=82378 RepID=UPI003B222186
MGLQKSVSVTKGKGLHFMHFNTRSLLPKISELRCLISDAKPAAVAISETWLDESVPDNEINIQGYAVPCHDRDREGGGVCVYVHNDIAFNNRLDLQSDCLENLWLEILLPKTKPIFFGVFYRPPDDTKFLTYFEDSISKIRSDCEMIIMGDINIDCFKKEVSLFKDYLHILNLFDLRQLITTATRITDTTSTCIDHILTNNPEKMCQSGTISIGLSDHLLIFCTRKAVRGQVGQHRVINIRSTKNYSKDIFLSKLSSINWSSVYKCTDVNHAWDLFSTILLKIIDDIAPMKQIRLKSRTEPWMDDTILDSIRTRDQLLYDFKEDRSNADLYKQYCKVRNKIQRDIKRAKAEYFSSKIDEHKNNPKKLWQQLKALGYSTKTKEQCKVVLEIDGETCFDSTKVADHINTFYTTVASNLVKKLPLTKNEFSTDSKKIPEVLF